MWDYVPSVAKFGSFILLTILYIASDRFRPMPVPAQGPGFFGKELKPKQARSLTLGEGLENLSFFDCCT